MKSTINPFKWANYTKMIVEVDQYTKAKFGEVNLYNIDKAAYFALETLTKEAIRRNMSVDEFAYVLYAMNNDSVAYMAIFALEDMYGKIPSNERERIVDGVASAYYRLMSGIEVDESEIASIYLPTYQRIGIHAHINEPA